MKKTILALLMLSFLTNVYSQAVTEEDFKNYNGNELVLDEEGDIDYVKSALNIKDLYGLDKNNAITRTTIIDAPGKNKDQVYVEVNNWFVHSFNSGKSVIQLNDKEAGVVIGKGFINNVAKHTSFASNANIHAWIIIRIDIKDDKFRVMTTIQSYEMEVGTGVLGAIGGDTSTTRDTWQPEQCFPFDGKRYKKTTSKAFVNCHIWSQIIINKLIEGVVNGITGTEGDW
ncbi:MAG: DUF4468 domain-containing protein [Bacteroides nordii]